MAWVRLDDHFDQHPKVLNQGYRGRWLYVAALCYCNRMLTDGFVPSSALDSLCPHTTDDDICEAPRALAEALVVAGLWDIADRRGIAGFRIHDYRNYQPSRREVVAERERIRQIRSAAGAQGGRPAKTNGKQTESNLVSKRKANGKQLGKQTESPDPDPDPRKDLITRSTTTGAVPAAPALSSPLIVSPLRYEKARESFAFFGSRLRVPHVLHQEFATKLGRYSDKLPDWYLQVNDGVAASGEPIPDVFAWLRPKFKTWAESLSGDAELARFLSGEV